MEEGLVLGGLMGNPPTLSNLLSSGSLAALAGHLFIDRVGDDELRDDLTKKPELVSPGESDEWSGIRNDAGRHKSGFMHLFEDLAAVRQMIFHGFTGQELKRRDFVIGEKIVEIEESVPQTLKAAQPHGGPESARAMRETGAVTGMNVRVPSA